MIVLNADDLRVGLVLVGLIVVVLVIVRLLLVRSNARPPETVAVAGRSAEADAVAIQSLLAGHGIDAQVVSNATLGWGGLSFGRAAYTVVVPRESLDAARAVLADLDRDRRGRAQGERACPACGEHNPAHFESCWECGAAL